MITDVYNQLDTTTKPPTQNLEVGPSEIFEFNETEAIVKPSN